MPDNVIKFSRNSLFNLEYYNSGNISYFYKDFKQEDFKRIYDIFIQRIVGSANFYKKLGLSGGQLKVLDIGCGLGYLVKTLSDSGFDARGIDFSEYAIKNPCSPMIAHRVLEGDILHLDEYYEDNFFDVITACHIFEYCLDEDMINDVIEQISKVAKSGARFMIALFTDSNKTNRNADSFYDKLRSVDKSALDWCDIFTYNDHINVISADGMPCDGEITIFTCSVHKLIEEKISELYAIKV